MRFLRAKVPIIIENMVIITIGYYVGNPIVNLSSGLPSLTGGRGESLLPKFSPQLFGQVLNQLLHDGIDGLVVQRLGLVLKDEIDCV